MMIQASRKLSRHLQSGLFVVLVIVLCGLLAWLSQIYHVRLDLTAGARNSLSDSSLQLLKNIDQPIRIEAFVSPANETREAIEELLQRYVQNSTEVTLAILNPDLEPQKLRDYDIRIDGEVVLSSADGRFQKVTRLSEENLSNALQRLLRSSERWLVFLAGHGERSAFSEANFDLGLWAQELGQKGFQVEELRTSETASIPGNTDVLVVASPQTALLPGEINLIREWLSQGGDMLWLHDPEADNSAEAILNGLGLETVPGVIVDPNTQMLGLQRPDFALVAQYPAHPITREIDSLSLYPQALGLEHTQVDDWKAEALLQTLPNSWNETGPLQGSITQGDNSDEISGPFSIAWALSRLRETEIAGELIEIEQRVVISGDADFISNQYLGNGANLDVSLNMMNWLSHDDDLIAVNPKPAPDIDLNLSNTVQYLIGFGFLFVLPGLLLGVGARIWWVRRNA